MKVDKSTTAGELVEYSRRCRELYQLIQMICPELFAADESTRISDYAKNFEKLQLALNGSMDVIAKSGKLIWDVYTGEETGADASKAKVQLLFFPVSAGKPFVLILSGGGYHVVATLDEGIHIAQAVNELGYNAFVLNYRVAEENLREKPVEDVASALRLIFSHCQEWNVDPTDYAVAGFSAGGHLAGLWCTDNHGYKNYDLPRPGVLIGAYSSVSPSKKLIQVKYGFGTKRDLFHAARSVRLLCGSDASAEELAKYDVDKHVSKNCPPTYLIHGEMDVKVYCSDSEALALALEEQGVKCRLRLVPDTDHAFGTGSGTPAEGWLNEAFQFWQESRVP